MMKTIIMLSKVQTIVALMCLPAVLSPTSAPSVRAESSTLVISEVYYYARTEPEEEWVEVYNLGETAIDLTNYKVGDEETRGRGEGMVQFPSGATIESGQVIVIANKATAFFDLYGFNPDYEMSDSDPAVPNMTHYGAWADGSFGLNNSGDEVLILDGSDTVVDAMSYGTSSVFTPGVPAVLRRHSLERYPADKDTDTSADWIDQDTPDPGKVKNLIISIYDIQATTDPSGDSPLKDSTDVTTEGVVTALFDNGYFIEEPAGGAWSGLWVSDPSNTPARGDRMRLTGTVIEDSNLTELSSLTGYEVLSGGNAVPETILATGNVSQEQWESVLAGVKNVTVINENLGNGEWSVSDRTGEVVVGNKGRYTYDPVNGDSLVAVIGPLDYAEGSFKIQPRDDGDIVLPPPPFVINEIHADPGGGIIGDANGDGTSHASQDEFVEIVNRSGSDVDISGWTLADNFKVRHIFPESTVVPANCAVVVFGGGNPTGTFGGAVVQTASSGVLFLNNGGDTLTLNDGSTDQATAIYGSEGGDNQSLTRDPDITGIGFVKHTTATGSDGALFSPGTMVDGSSFEGCRDEFVCGGPATPIHVIQGSGSSSSEVGNTHEIEGVVVGDFQDKVTQLGGFFLQEEDTDIDSDSATSEGIFIYDNGFGVDVNVGDIVRVRGTVAEFHGLTELLGISDKVVCSSGGSVSVATVTLPVCSLDVWEQYEGMLVNIQQDLTVTDHYDLGRYGQVDLSLSRLYNPTHSKTPGPEANALDTLNDRNCIILDDANTDVNRDPIVYPVPGLSANNTLRTGYTVSDLTGVLDHRFGTYRIQPVGPVDFAPDNPRPAMPDPVYGTLKVASFNVLNYFNGDGLGSGFPGPRGASSAEEFTRQRDKIVRAITALDADVIGLIEIENDGYGVNSAIQDLVSGLNAFAPAGITYSFVNPGFALGTDDIKVAFVYRVETVRPSGAAATTTDEPFDTRPPLAQTFEEIATGERFTAVVNHFKSKRECPDDGSLNEDQNDGQGCWNLRRTQASATLTDWLATDPTGSGDPDFLIIGDLNACAQEDPISVIKDAGYSDLVDEFIGSNAYTYVYGGESSYLDHALANDSLRAQVTSVTVWHINADEPRSLDYNVEYKSPGQIISLYGNDPYRSSDHDPVVIGLCLTSGERGDVNGDGTTDILDVLEVVNHIIGSGGPFTNPAFLCLADCISDGEIDVLDVLAIVNVILGIFPECPGGTL
ncbi:MAG: ExeM/NucH family extracellular endonuclease [Gemmatimonadota bacterium]|nr:MAG: ExeM/NucH family extracellular endonuclease [Gemmatimonadota bacterium]